MVSSQAFDEVISIVRKLSDRRDYFMGMTISFWVVAVALMATSWGSAYIHIALLLAGTISLSISVRAWLGLRRINAKIVRFGYENALNPENEVKKDLH